MRAVTFGLLVGAAIASTAPARAASAGPDATLRDKVRAAALVTYVHGMTDAIAAKEVGPEGVPALLDLLADPAFPRRDNVVAFLAHLPSERSVPRLLAQLERPVADVHRAVEDRAMLLIPHALGWIAKSGDEAALDALLDITAPHGQGGVLARAVAARRYGDDLRGDLILAAVRALSLSERTEARVRLSRLAAGKSGAILPGLDVAPSARRAREAPSGGSAAVSSAAAPASFGAFDVSALAHDTTMTYANHVDIVAEPALGMTDAEVDAALRLADGVSARVDFPNDVSCCHRLTRGAPGVVFGSHGDRRDVIYDPDVLEAVLSLPVARVKVVRAITWCGAPATNIIGCSWFPGDGMAVVKLGDGNDGILWLHEYGHNAGLPHYGLPNYVMNPYLSYRNWSLLDVECAAFHAPPPETHAAVAESGSCVDADGDGVPWTGDNCEGLFNPGQFDPDLDSRGTDCDNCPNVANYDQDDGDGDGVGEACDRCPGLFDDQNDLDADGRGDACDVCPRDPDDDGDGDGQCADRDNCAWTANADQSDGDGDGRGDACDRCPDDAGNDFDADGICSGQDRCPWASSPAEADWTFRSNDRLQRLIATGVGDVNGDGFDDVAIARPDGDVRAYPWDLLSAGEVRFFAGSASGLAAQPSWILRGVTMFQFFGRTVAPAGDVDGDGYADLLIASIDQDSSVSSGQVQLFRGGPAGPSPIASWTAIRSGKTGFGLSLAGNGDVNCDGRLDVAIADPWDYSYATQKQGLVEIFFGGSTGVPSGSPVTLVPDTTGSGNFGLTMTLGGDFDGDGCRDLVVGNPSLSPGRVKIYYGPVRGTATEPVLTLVGTNDGERFGSAVARAGDLDGDGLDDLAIGASGHRPGVRSNPVGAVFVYRGNQARAAGVPTRILPVDTDVQGFGGSIAGPGDVDGDGHRDLLVGATAYAFVLHGGPGGLASVPMWTRGGGSDGYGVSAADVNGDSFADVVVQSSPQAFSAGTFLSGPGGPQGNGQVDTDGDGEPDACDADRDGDGVANGADLCPANYDPYQPNGDADSRGDACDNCPAAFNPNQEDFDEDAVGDACDPDADGDGVIDESDNCARIPNPSQIDVDTDGRGSACDNCPQSVNPDQEDTDRDAIGDVCDADLDGDGRLNGSDNCVGIRNADQLDYDLDGIGDACDPCADKDHDGFPEAFHFSPGCTGLSGRKDCDDLDATTYPGAFESCDGKDNDCNGLFDDALCSDFVLASYERVDGTTLGELGRAFGQCSSTPASEWWSVVEYTGDRCVDGQDLAVLGAIWACAGDTPICAP